MENQPTLREQFDDELASASSHPVLRPGYQKRKLLMWFVRVVILALMYAIFWEHRWVPKTLYVVVPLNVLSLLAIMVIPYMIKRKIEKTKAHLESVDQSYDDE
ncbi:hypothetical protein FLLO111716_12335 [Flavobacterium longum]